MASNDDDVWEVDYALVSDEILACQQQQQQRASRTRLSALEAQLAQLKSRLLQLDANGNHASATTTTRWKKLSGLSRRLGELAAASYVGGGGEEEEDAESAVTRHMLQEQDSIMDRQDGQLEDLSRSIYRLTGVAETIGDTAQAQTRLLGEMDEETDDVHAAVRSDTRKIGLVTASQDTRKLHCIILALVLFFILLLILK